MPGPLQISVANGVDAGRQLELSPGTYLFGRNADTDFPIDDPTVSGAHCEIEAADEALHVRDLGSTNGTFIDGQRIDEGTVLPGQTLRLGDVELNVERAVVISVPQVDLSEAPVIQTRDDGTPVCSNHPSLDAVFICPECSRNYCVTCVHKLKRVGGQILVLCPACSAHCEVVAGKEGRRKRKSLFGLLRHTLKIPAKH